MKVGVVSLGWPPVWSGGETYLYRIVNALNDNGIEATGITATSADSKYDSGMDNVIRIVPPFAPEITKDTTKIMFQDPNDNYRSLTKTEQIERMMIWSGMINDELEEDEFDIGIIYVENLTSLSEIDYRKLFGRPFKKLISISFDLDYGIYLNFEKNLKENQTLLEIIEENKKTINTIFGKKPYEFVLHPLMESKWITKPVKSFTEKIKKGDFKVGMINPIPKKGSDVMLRVIAQSPFKFKILEGGHGNGDVFISSLKGEYNYDFKERVELIHYVEDIVEFFDSIDVLFMPSSIEGYGQVAHEALMRGTPVITKLFPTIQEATLNEACFVKPTDYWNINTWLESLDEIYHNQQMWKTKALNTRQKLIDRQDKEIKEFLHFLMNMKV